MNALISYMMCVYNDIRTLDRAVESLLFQEMTDWELVIYDNSDNEHMGESRKKLHRLKESDSRIKVIEGDGNVGWAKGAAVCLEYVSGEYVSFLAVDDAIRHHSLTDLRDIMIEEAPDLIFVGYDRVILNNSGEEVLESKVPQKAKYDKDNRSETMALIMSGTYYNSFFHYMKTRFLKSEGIDFFEPYYGDCAGMVRAISKAEDIICHDEVVYSLSVNTSQTKGWAIWDFYSVATISQWRSAKEVFTFEKYKNEEIIAYVAGLFVSNLVGSYSNLCHGRCRDKYMNSKKVTFSDIIMQLNDAITNEEIQEMLALADKEIFRQMLKEWSFDGISDSTINKIPDCNIMPLVNYFIIMSDGDINTEKRMRLLIEWLNNDINRFYFGINEFMDVCDIADQKVLQKYETQIRQIAGSYTKVSAEMMNHIRNFKY